MKKIVYCVVFLFFIFTLASNAAETRTWTTTDGRKIEAELVKISEDGKTVTLQRADGRTGSLVLERLSKEDQDYIRNKNSSLTTPLKPIPPASQSSVKNIWEAAQKGTVKDVEYFIRQGADVNAKDTVGYTPLFYAVRQNIDIVKCLVESGANVNAKTEWGSTVLQHTLAGKFSVDIVKYLVDNGADVNMEGQFGRTPLQSLIAKYRTLKDVKEKAAFMEIAGFEEIARMVDAEEAKFDKAEKAERERLALRQRQWEQQRQWEGQLAWERELAKKKELSWERKQAEFRAPYAPTPPNTATPFTNTGDRRTLTYTPTPSRERVAPTPQMERCPGCDGRGDRICNTCRGKGYTRTCSTCRGTGTLQKPDRDAGKRCSNCKGTGNQPCGSGCNGTGKFPCNYGNCRGSGFITK